MYRKFAELLRPFHREYRVFVAGTVLRQGLLVGGGYLLVWALQMCLAHKSLSEWVLVAAFVLYDAVSLRFDIGLNYFFSARVSYPLFGRLRTGALEKVLR